MRRKANTSASLTVLLMVFLTVSTKLDTSGTTLRFTKLFAEMRGVTRGMVGGDGNRPGGRDYYLLGNAGPHIGVGAGQHAIAEADFLRLQRPGPVDAFRGLGIQRGFNEFGFDEHLFGHGIQVVDEVGDD